MGETDEGGDLELQMVDTLSRVETIMANVQSLINKQSVESKALLQRDQERKRESLEFSNKLHTILPRRSVSSEGVLEDEQCRKSLEEDKAHLEEENLRLESQVGELTATLDAERASAKALAEENAALQQQLKQQEQRADEVAAQLQQLQESNAKSEDNDGKAPPTQKGSSTTKTREEGVTTKTKEEGVKKVSKVAKKAPAKATKKKKTQETKGEPKEAMEVINVDPLAQIEELEQKVHDYEALESKLTQKTSELEKALKEVSDLEAELQSAKALIEVMKKEGSGALHEKNEELEKELRSLIQTSQAKDEQIRALTLGMEQIKEEMVRAQTQIEEERICIQQQAVNERMEQLAESTRQRELDLMMEREDRERHLLDLQAQQAMLQAQDQREADLRHIALKDELQDVKASSAKQSQDHEELQQHVEKTEEELKERSQRLKKLETEYSTSIARYKQEAELRRKLFNQLQELKGNIRVLCRVRPLIPSCDSKNAVFNPKIDPENYELTLSELKDGTSGKYTKQHRYEFDKVLDIDADQDAVFQEVQPLVTSTMDGYNVCIFCYGQTGSGKTYTMEGVKGSPGISQRTVQALFQEQAAREENWTYKISVSVLEIYNDNVFDLLGPAGEVRDKKIEVRLTRQGRVIMPDAKVVPVTSAEETLKVLEKGQKNRAQGQTDFNLHSSRSHCMLTIYIEGENRVATERVEGKLHLVDLAGSEKLSRLVTGDQLTESVSINKSLSALGDVVAALAKKDKHVPFRNSQLTFSLQDSLGGDSKVVMFVNISPAEKHVVESVNALNFASRVRKVELGKAKKNVTRLG